MSCTQREKEDLEQAHNQVKRDFEEQARKIKSLDNEFNETQGKLRKETDCVATLTSAIDRARYETFNVTLSWCSLSWLLFSDARLHKHIATLKRRSRVRRTI